MKLMKNLTVDWVADYLKSKGIDRVFLYPGGTIAPLINAFIDKDILIDVFKSEQGAGYAALAYARVTGKTQVCMVTSGPGVTNVISPLADAYYDSTPLLLITGQIGTADLTIRKNVRQRGFQETPTIELVKPLSKYASCLLTEEQVYTDLPIAFNHTVDGRKGPSVIDFPMDIQRTEVSETPTIYNKVTNSLQALTLSFDAFKEVARYGECSKRPVILLGQGALSSGEFNLYIEVANKLNAIVVTSFLGIGSFDTNSDRCMGYIGHTGNQVANHAVNECDFLLVLGARLDLRQTGTVVDEFAKNADIVWVDIDANELENPRVSVKWKIHLDVKKFCNGFLEVLDKSNTCAKDWHEGLLNLKKQKTDDVPNKESNYIQPRELLDQISNAMNNDSTIVVTGVGCHQHWAARHLPYNPYLHAHMTSGGHGTMGYDLPSSIGAAMACPEKTVLCVVGDGSLLMNIQELASLCERQLNVKILVMNNSRLGIVSQFQLITWGSDPTTGDFISPNFSEIAKGFGVPSKRVELMSSLYSQVDWFWKESGPVLLEVMIDPDSDVTPMLLAGQNLGEMWEGRIS
mgnify:FL=1